MLIFRASLFMFCGFDAYLGQMFTAHLNPSVIFFQSSSEKFVFIYVSDGRKVRNHANDFPSTKSMSRIF